MACNKTCNYFVFAAAFTTAAVDIDCYICSYAIWKDGQVCEACGAFQAFIWYVQSIFDLGTGQGSNSQKDESLIFFYSWT